jgi:RNA-directed DNA polymerase
VLRFKYNERLYVVKGDGEVSSISINDYNDNGDTTKKFSIDDSIHQKNCEKYLCTSYRKFLSFLEEDRKNKQDKLYYLFVSEGHALIASQDILISDKIVVKLFYKFENKEIENLFKQLSKIKDDNGKVIPSNIHNNFNFITSNLVLELFLVEANLRARFEKPFRRFKLTSKNGKVRDITAPHDEIKVVLQKMNYLFQNVFDKRNADFQVAYKKGKNIKTNADIHINNKFVYNIDLKDFYPSCKRDLVEKYTKFLFKASINSDVLHNMFLDIVLQNNGLFIGSPISGTLANVIISKPVAYMKKISKKYGMEFSVYADDMTFSSDKFIPKTFVVNIFNHAFTQYDLNDYFKINKKKLNGMSKNKRRITGVSINNDDKTTVSRKFYRNLRVKIHKLSLGEVDININKLRGQIAFASMVDGTGKIYKLLEKFEDVRSKFKLCSDIKMNELKLKAGA